jgi:ATP-binding cassette, subfamily F, member 3
MFSVNDLSKRFGDTLLFENVSFAINPGDRIGLVGPNGSGKSTLLRMLVGNEPRESGSITRVPGTAVGYLRQGFADVPDGTLGDLLDIPTHGLISAQRALDAATAAFGDPGRDPDEVATAFEHASDMFDTLGGYASLAELEALLDRFGLAGMTMSRLLKTLSGGQKTRAGLAGLLASRPDLLVLDEPTNHLDADALGWLDAFLTGYRGAVLIVSHDRGFLDAIVTRIFELDPVTRTLRSYAGSYSDFVDAKRNEEEEAQAAWQRQQAEVARVKRDIQAIENKARTIEASTIDYAVRKKAAKIARPGVVRKKKLERMLEDEDAASRPERRWGMSLDFAWSTDGARDVIRLTNVHVALGGHVILSGVDLLVRHGDRVAILGPNGSGKTTLMRVIMGDLAPDAGEVRIGAGVKVGYFAQEQQTLNRNRTVLEQARSAAAMSESDLRTFLHKFLFGGDTVHRRVGELSYGERARLMLALLVLRGNTVLLLDEPLNHLDIEAREEFEQALEQFQGTTLMVLHDRYTVQRLANRVIEMRDGVPVESRLEVPA